ncbi:zinc-binding dehydrogenase [Nocardioides sp. CCNWLW239]|uniref:quinone oxidoreductase family protein n=1 Tax=Nocardioides sp. CCNWLW239 TaxID=3128902 RepID=UPI00301AF561
MQPTLPTTMRAVRFHDWGTTLSVDTLPLPEPSGQESLVRIDAAAVAHLDVTVASGRFDIRPTLPYVAGVEGAGTVLSSPTMSPGTRVVVRGAGVGLTRSGTWAEYAAVPEDALTVLPEDLAPEVAASFFVPGTTALAALDDVGRLGRWFEDVSAHDEVVVVTGATGAVGAMVTQLALARGCVVLAVVSRPERAALVPVGAEIVVASRPEEVAGLAAARPGTLLVDTLGGPGLGDRAGWIRPGGRAALVGYTAGEDVSLHLPNWFSRDVAYLPVNMIQRTQLARAAVPDLVSLLAAGTLMLPVEVYALGDAQDAVDALRGRRASGRVVIQS